MIAALCVGSRGARLRAVGQARLKIELCHYPSADANLKALGRIHAPCAVFPRPERGIELPTPSLAQMG